MLPKKESQWPPSSLTLAVEHRCIATPRLRHSEAPPSSSFQLQLWYTPCQTQVGPCQRSRKQKKYLFVPLLCTIAVATCCLAAGVPGGRFELVGQRSATCDAKLSGTMDEAAAETLYFLGDLCTILTKRACTSWVSSVTSFVTDTNNRSTLDSSVKIMVAPCPCGWMW